MNSVQRMGDRAATFPPVWLVAAFTLTQLADLLSAMVVARELNPIAAALVERPLLALALKLGLIALVVAVAEICDRHRLTAHGGGLVQVRCG